ncbi:MAG: hypothetical protein JWL81_1920 [Verrucomicrobiales bacterium]|nr:hypothetical protein [Verrucomicrobiales bacterium]
MSDPIDPENALPASPRDCVSTGPPPAGVLVREPDLAWRPAQAMSKEIVMLDVQHEVDGHVCHRRLVPGRLPIAGQDSPGTDRRA